jgi:glycosyltransferase involved in cell wall biosynthesis
VSVFDTLEDVGLVGSKLLYPDNSLQEAGCIVWADGSAWNLGRNDDPRRPEYNYLRDTHYSSGCSLITQAERFRELGGFDLVYQPGYYEDIDYAYKIRQLGLRVIYQPASQLIHFEGKTGGTDISSGAKRYQTKNRETFKTVWSEQLALEAQETQSVYRVDNHQSKARVLFIEPTHLTFDQDAGSAMSYNLILAMLKMRFKVTFVAAESFTYHDRYSRLLQAAGVECLYRPYYTSLADVFDARPDAWDYIFIARLHCISEVFDEVVAANPSAKIVYQTIDLSFLRESRELELNHKAGNKLAVKHKEEKELEFIRACTKSIIVSDFEYDMLRQRGLADKVATMPMLAYDYPAPSIENRSGVMFIGGFRHQPNTDAVHFLADEIVPLVVEELPNVIFYIVGGDVPEELAAKASPNLIFMGQINNPDRMFMSMRASVAPLRFGAGIKGKVIQSMAAGLPCVGTPIALEGIGSPLDTGVQIADDARGIADGLIRLLKDDQLWQQSARAGYAFATQLYTPDALQRDVANFFNALN